MRSPLEVGLFVVFTLMPGGLVWGGSVYPDVRRLMRPQQDSTSQISKSSDVHSLSPRQQA
jgi:hypothetical protein